MTPQEVIDYYGNDKKASAGLDVSKRAIELWLEAGKIPRLTQLAIQCLTNGDLLADENKREQSINEHTHGVDVCSKATGVD